MPFKKRIVTEYSQKSMLVDYNTDIYLYHQHYVDPRHQKIFMTCNGPQSFAVLRIRVFINVHLCKFWTLYAILINEMGWFDQCLCHFIQLLLLSKHATLDCSANKFFQHKSILKTTPVCFISLIWSISCVRCY